MSNFRSPLAFLVACVLGGLISMPAEAARPVILHVAPDGNDAWSGTLARPNPAQTDGPLASLTGARDTVRRLKERGLHDAPIRVQFTTGTYTLSAPVEFLSRDSGTEASPIIYEAAPRAKPLFTGGRAITGWKPAPNGVWTASVPGVKEGWYFEQLWVNGERATRAHPYPKSARLNIRGRLASLLSLLIGNRGSPRYVGLRRFRWVWAWAWLAHCPLYHTNACNTRNPSAKTCAPGCPSPARAQNPASMATRMLAWSRVSFELAVYRAVSFF